MSFKRLLHRMWFALYPRARRTKGSCAFEHVFLGEVKNGKVNGFHNWLFFLLEEQKGKKISMMTTLDYLINVYTRLSFCHFFPLYTLLLDPTCLLNFSPYSYLHDFDLLYT